MMVQSEIQFDCFIYTYLNDSQQSRVQSLILYFSMTRGSQSNIINYTIYATYLKIQYLFSSVPLRYLN